MIIPMRATLEEIRRASLEAIEGVIDAEALEALRVKYLGKKGELTAVLKSMGGLDPAERPVMGQLANEVRSRIEDAIASKASDLKRRLMEQKLALAPADLFFFDDNQPNVDGAIRCGWRAALYC